jgi:hypothetical protein
MTQASVVNQFGDWRWRLSNLYWVRNEQNVLVPFRPRPEQVDLLTNMDFWNVILKARQLGFTTLLDIFGLDQSFFADIQAAIIAHERPAVEEIFRLKVQEPHKNLPEALHDWNPTQNDTANKLTFKRGGAIEVAMSVRSGTKQFLHVSEFGKIARRYPERATEIITGSFPSVHEDGMVFVESTAEGTGGAFYDMVEGARELDAAIKASPRKRHRMEFKLHFYPWWKDPKYSVDPEGVKIPPHLAKYFYELEKKHGIKLTAGQAAWYVITAAAQKKEMQREYPSHIDEAFTGANEERYFAEQMRLAKEQGRIKVIPYLPQMGVNLFFDIGRDTTCFWAHQFVRSEHRMIGYYGAVGKQYDHFAREIQRREYIVRNIYLPHDGDHESAGVGTQTPANDFRKLFPTAKVRVIGRTPAKFQSIEAARVRLHETYFHEIECAEGIEGLKNYRKKWSESLSNWSDEPLHNIHSHPSDAYQTFATGWEQSHESSSLMDKPLPGLVARPGVYR